MVNNNNNQLTKLRIYPSFTEVRNRIKAISPYKIYFNRSFYDQIIPGSINLEDVEVLSINSVEKENNLEGKILFIKKGDDDELRQVKVIRSRDLLVQDLKTKRYFNVLRDDFEYNDQPEEYGVDVTFVVHTPGEGVLSYLMKGIKWETRYTLDVEYDDYDYKGWGRIENDRYEFQGWADIINNTDNEYHIEHTELFGGDIHIQRSRPQVRHMAMRTYQVESCVASYKSVAAPTIKAVGETSGLYMYESDDAYKLDPNDRFSLPFLSPLITFDKVASCETYFNTTGGKGKFSRIYKISSNEFLPHGTVTVREDGRIVGQSNIPDLSADESHELNLGTDPDVSYERDIKQLFIRKDEAKYEVKIKISNNKQRDVFVRYSENLSGKYNITDTQPRSALVTKNNSISYENNLKSKETVTLKYVIHLDYKSENKQ